MDQRAGAIERAGLLRRVGALLKRLHETPAPAFFASETSWVERKVAEARESLAWCEGSADLLADLDRRRPTPVPEVFIHGDLALDNVLVTEDALGLVDWPGGDLGDPRYDLALALQTEPEVHLGPAEVGAFRLTRLPENAVPETVLARLADLDRDGVRSGAN